MARAPALANQMAAAIVTALKAINKTVDANKWLTKPTDVRREVHPADITQRAVPLICVQCKGWKSGAGELGDVHELDAEFDVHCMTRSAAGGEAMAISLAADCEVAIDQDEYLGTVLIEPIVSRTVVFNVEASAMTGLCVFTMNFRAKARFDHLSSLA